MPESKKVLSLFSGCGGMDLGLEGGFKVPSKYINPKMHPSWVSDTKNSDLCVLPRTSFQTVFANDIRPGARAAWVNYFGNVRGTSNPDSVFRLGSIVDIVKDATAGNSRLTNSEIDVVTGGFPCQDFSIAGKRNGFNSHKNHAGVYRNEEEPSSENRGLLYMWMKRVVEISQPKVFIAENVKGLISLKNAKNIIEKDFRNCGDTGYLVIPARVLKSFEYGIPQNRERVVFIGFKRASLSSTALRALSQDDIPREYDPYPSQTHILPDKIVYTGNFFHDDLLPTPNLRDAFKRLVEPWESTDLSQQTYSKAKWYGSHCQGQIEVNLDSIGPTIRAEHHGNIEFRRLSLEHGGKYENEIGQGLPERRLTVRECARIQTFPDDYDFVRHGTAEERVSGSEAYRLIGNAVPPFLIYHIAKRLEAVWDRMFKECT